MIDTSCGVSLVTVDEIAFALVEAERESTAAYRRADALKRLYKLAREAGCTRKPAEIVCRLARLYSP